MRARSVAKKRKKVEGRSLYSLIPRPKPLPLGEGVLEDGDLVLMTTAKFWRPTPSMNTLSRSEPFNCRTATALNIFANALENDQDMFTRSSNPSSSCCKDLLLYESD